MSKKILKNNNDAVMLITAAGSINSACNYNLSKKDPALLNIGTTLAVEEIKKKTNLKIILSVKKNINLLKIKPFKDIKIIEVGNTKSISETIQKSLEIIDCEKCLINPITSIPSQNEISDSFIEVGLKPIPKENWSSITFEEKNKIKFHSKLEKDSNGLISHPLTGRIFANKKDILLAIESLDDYEMNDLINIAKKLYFQTKIKIEFTKWLDIGHIATYPLTRVSAISSRFFNDLTYNKERNIIKKKSFKKSKIEEEINYYKSIPDDIKRYFPMILNIERNNYEISYEMDFICKPTLSEIYLFSEIGPNAIIRIFESIKRILKTFYSKKCLRVENAKWLYSEKAEKRQAELENLFNKKKYETLKRIYDNDFYLNEFKFPSLSKSFSLLKKELRGFEKQRPMHLGHGDLCFNNILVEPIYGEINLIDPRAHKHKILDEFGLIDNIYDLAKLNHSIEGLYDSVVNNLYMLKIQELNKIDFRVFKPHEYEIFNTCFKEIILSEEVHKTKHLRILTGNLFLTMIPLHQENLERMIALSLIGSIFLNDYKINKFLL